MTPIGPAIDPAQREGKQAQPANKTFEITAKQANNGLRLSKNSRPMPGLKGGFMKKPAIFAFVFCILLVGCASMETKNRLQNFSQIAEAYEKALRMSDFNAAAKFVDPSTAMNPPDISKMKAYKIVEYNITHVDVSENMREISQDVELQYFRLNSNILRTTHDSQIWRFDQQDDVWRLQTGLPVLRP